jgi:hypothetical protein
MGYGVTSSTLLILAGLTPGGRIGVGALQRAGHQHRLGCRALALRTSTGGSSRDRRPGRRRRLPRRDGAVQPLHEAAAPIMSAILAALGIYILARFIAGSAARVATAADAEFLAPLGVFAGFIDAHRRGRLGARWPPRPCWPTAGSQPRKVIGTVDTSEFAVSAAASIGFLVGLGAAGINWGFALALLAGGVIAAPWPPTWSGCPGPPARGRRGGHHPAHQRADDLRASTCDGTRPDRLRRVVLVTVGRLYVARHRAPAPRGRRGGASRRRHRGSAPFEPDPAGRDPSGSSEQGRNGRQHGLGELDHVVPAPPAGQGQLAVLEESTRRSPPSAGPRRVEDLHVDLVVARAG